MTPTTPFKAPTDTVLERILEFADNNAAKAVCKLFNKCQKTVIERLWRNFNSDQFPFINAWLNQNTIFGDRPQVVLKKPVVSEKHVTRLHQLLTAELQKPPKPVLRPIHPVSFQALEKEANDRNLVKMFPRLEKALKPIRHLLPADLDGVFNDPAKHPPHQIREWIRRATVALNERFLRGEGARVLIFDFSRLGLTAIPKEFAAFKPFMRDVRFAHNKLTFIPKGIFSDYPKLVALSFTNNLLRNLPDDFVSNCPHLGRLYLSQNRLEEIPSNVLSSCLRLYELALDENRLSRLPLKFLSNSPLLQDLDLSRNRLRADGLPIGFGSNWRWFESSKERIFAYNPMMPATLKIRMYDCLERCAYLFLKHRPSAYGLLFGLSCVVSKLVSSQIPFWAIPITCVIGCLACEDFIRSRGLYDERY